MRKVLEYLTNLWYHFIRNNKEGGNDMSEINKKLEAMANDILVKNDMLKLPVDLVQIAEKNKIEIYHADLPINISGAIKYNGKTEKFQILINENDPFKRQRFTLAHELAHFFLQGEELKEKQGLHFDTLYRRNFDHNEVQVDYLAGALLMEKDMVTKLYKINSSAKVLASVFQVSESAMTVRLMKLGLI
ncbi:MAG: ImmA/IrrE family metallo-endopeptidase [Firmicutes bacterium]|nr:ImmA/IrrE family metallo-endopeptidase [Bacillota bacterium]